MTLLATVAGEEVDPLELKILLITQGIQTPSSDVYEQLGRTWRLSPNPLECSCLLLPGNIVVHLAVVGAVSPFSLGIGENGRPFLAHRGEVVTEVSFPPKTEFYEQRTSSGRPFRGMGVLQGVDVLSFPYLWPCEYASAGLACQFCHTGGYSQQLAKEGSPEPTAPSAHDVAEAVRYAVITEKVTQHIQVTGGATITPQAECRRVVEILDTIGEVAGFDKIPGEISVFTSPPAEPSLIDEVFAAGADRVACDIEIWNDELAARICPGKSRFAGRERHLRTLLHIAEKFGPNKACSAFVVGLEPPESFLAGAEFLARRGVVPVVSVWMPHGRPVLGRTVAPGLDFYRRVRDRIAELYEQYGIIPPGGAGFNVCICRDIWNQQIRTRANCCQRSCTAKRDAVETRTASAP